MREYSKPFHPAKLFELCEELLSYRAWLVRHLIDAEADYRQKIIDYKNEEILEKDKIIKRTNAEAENLAKTTKEYKDYKYLSYIDSLIDQQVMLVKKFADKLGNE